MECEYCGKTLHRYLRYKGEHCFCNEQCLGKYLVDLADGEIEEDYAYTEEEIEMEEKIRWRACDEDRY